MKIARIIIIVLALAVIVYALIPALTNTYTALEPINENPDFETGDLRGWTKTGDAFDYQPTLGDNVMVRRGDKSGHHGKWWIGGYEKYQGQEGQNPGDDQSDMPTGTLTSTSFIITGDRISFLVGGGRHPWVEPDGANSVCVILIVDGKVVRTATGSPHETMKQHLWNVAKFKGKEASIQIVDNNTGGWGHINFDHVFQTTKWQSERGNFIIYLWAGIMLLLLAVDKKKRDTQ